MGCICSSTKNTQVIHPIKINLQKNEESKSQGESVNNQAQPLQTNINNSAQKSNDLNDNHQDGFSNNKEEEAQQKIDHIEIEKPDQPQEELNIKNIDKINSLSDDEEDLKKANLKIQDKEKQDETINLIRNQWKILKNQELQISTETKESIDKILQEFHKQTITIDSLHDIIPHADFDKACCLTDESKMSIFQYALISGNRELITYIVTQLNFTTNMDKTLFWIYSQQYQRAFMQVMSNYQIFIALLSVTVKTNMILLLKQFSELKEQSFDISKKLKLTTKQGLHCLKLINAALSTCEDRLKETNSNDECLVELKKSLTETYHSYKHSYYFQNCKIPKHFGKNIQYLVIYFNSMDFQQDPNFVKQGKALKKHTYNILHECLRQQNYQQFNKFLQVATKFLLQENSSGESPLFLYFQQADYDSIAMLFITIKPLLNSTLQEDEDKEEIKQNNNDNINSQQEFLTHNSSKTILQYIEFTQTKRDNILHKIISNKNLTSFQQATCILEIQNIVSPQAFQQLLISADYYNKIPLVYYIQQYKSYDTNVIDKLIPNIKKEHYQDNMGFFWDDYFNILYQSEINGKYQEYILNVAKLNNELINVCLNKGSNGETILLYLLQQRGCHIFIELDTYLYIQGLCYEKLCPRSQSQIQSFHPPHFLEKAIARNCNNLLDYFFNQKQQQNSSYLPYQQMIASEQFQQLAKNNQIIKSDRSIIDIILAILVEDQVRCGAQDEGYQQISENMKIFLKKQVKDSINDNLDFIYEILIYQTPFVHLCAINKNTRERCYFPTTTLNKLSFIFGLETVLTQFGLAFENIQDNNQELLGQICFYSLTLGDLPLAQFMQSKINNNQLFQLRMENQFIHKQSEIFLFHPRLIKLEKIFDIYIEQHYEAFKNLLQCNSIKVKCKINNYFLKKFEKNEFKELPFQLEFREQCVQLHFVKKLLKHGLFNKFIENQNFFKFQLKRIIELVVNNQLLQEDQALMKYFNIFLETLDLFIIECEKIISNTKLNVLLCKKYDDLFWENQYNIDLIILLSIKGFNIQLPHSPNFSQYLRFIIEQQQNNNLGLQVLQECILNGNEILSCLASKDQYYSIYQQFYNCNINLNQSQQIVYLKAKVRMAQQKKLLATSLTYNALKNAELLMPYFDLKNANDQKCFFYYIDNVYSEFYIKNNDFILTKNVIINLNLNFQFLTQKLNQQIIEQETSLEQQGLKKLLYINYDQDIDSILVDLNQYLLWNEQGLNFKCKHYILRVAPYLNLDSLMMLSKQSFNIMIYQDIQSIELLLQHVCQKGSLKQTEQLGEICLQSIADIINKIKKMNQLQDNNILNKITRILINNRLNRSLLMKQCYNLHLNFLKNAIEVLDILQNQEKQEFLNNNSFVDQNNFTFNDDDNNNRNLTSEFREDQNKSIKINKNDQKKYNNQKQKKEKEKKFNATNFKKQIQSLFFFSIALLDLNQRESRDYLLKLIDFERSQNKELMQHQSIKKIFMQVLILKDFELIQKLVININPLNMHSQIFNDQYLDQCVLRYLLCFNQPFYVALDDFQFQQVMNQNKSYYLKTIQNNPKECLLMCKVLAKSGFVDKLKHIIGLMQQVIDNQQLINILFKLIRQVSKYSEVHESQNIKCRVQKPKFYVSFCNQLSNKRMRSRSNSNYELTPQPKLDEQITQNFYNKEQQKQQNHIIQQHNQMQHQQYEKLQKNIQKVYNTSFHKTKQIEYQQQFNDYEKLSEFYKNYYDSKSYQKQIGCLFSCSLIPNPNFIFEALQLNGYQNYEESLSYLFQLLIQILGKSKIQLTQQQEMQIKDTMKNRIVACLQNNLNGISQYIQLAEINLWDSQTIILEILNSIIVARPYKQMYINPKKQMIQLAEYNNQPSIDEIFKQSAIIFINKYVNVQYIKQQWMSKTANNQLIAHYSILSNQKLWQKNKDVVYHLLQVYHQNQFYKFLNISEKQMLGYLSIFIKMKYENKNFPQIITNIQNLMSFSRSQTKFFKIKSIPDKEGEVSHNIQIEEENLAFTFFSLPINCSYTKWMLEQNYNPFNPYQKVFISLNKQGFYLELLAIKGNVEILKYFKKQLKSSNSSEIIDISKAALKSKDYQTIEFIFTTFYDNTNQTSLKLASNLILQDDLYLNNLLKNNYEKTFNFLFFNYLSQVQISLNENPIIPQHMFEDVKENIFNIWICMAINCMEKLFIKLATYYINKMKNGKPNQLFEELQTKSQPSEETPFTFIILNNLYEVMCFLESLGLQSLKQEILTNKDECDYNPISLLVDNKSQKFIQIFTQLSIDKVGNNSQTCELYQKSINMFKELQSYINNISAQKHKIFHQYMQCLKFIEIICFQRLLIPQVYNYTLNNLQSFMFNYPQLVFLIFNINQKQNLQLTNKYLINEIFAIYIMNYLEIDNVKIQLKIPPMQYLEQIQQLKQNSLLSFMKSSAVKQFLTIPFFLRNIQSGSCVQTKGYQFLEIYYQGAIMQNQLNLLQYLILNFASIDYFKDKFFSQNIMTSLDITNQFLLYDRIYNQLPDLFKDNFSNLFYSHYNITKMRVNQEYFQSIKKELNDDIIYQQQLSLKFLFIAYTHRKSFLQFAYYQWQENLSTQSNSEYKEFSLSNILSLFSKNVNYSQYLLSETTGIRIFLTNIIKATNQITNLLAIFNCDVQQNEFFSKEQINDTNLFQNFFEDTNELCSQMVQEFIQIYKNVQIMNLQKLVDIVISTVILPDFYKDKSINLLQPILNISKACKNRYLSTLIYSHMIIQVINLFQQISQDILYNDFCQLINNNKIQYIIDFEITQINDAIGQSKQQNGINIKEINGNNVTLIFNINQYSEKALNQQIEKGQPIFFSNLQVDFTDFEKQIDRIKDVFFFKNQKVVDSLNLFINQINIINNDIKFSLNCQDKDVINDVQEEFLPQSFRIAPLKIKEAILNQLQSNNIMFSQEFGIQQLLNDIGQLQEQMILLTKYYSLDDMFAPHNIGSMNPIQQQTQQVNPSQSIIRTQHMQVSNDQQENQGGQINEANPAMMQSSHGIRSVIYSQTQIKNMQMSYILEQMPDNTYQVRLNQQKRQKGSNHYQELVFNEFYEIQKNILMPQGKAIQLEYLEQREFENICNSDILYKTVLNHILNYDELMSIAIKKTADEAGKQAENLFSNKWYFSFDQNNEKLLYEPALFPYYNIVQLLSQLNQFLNNIKLYQSRKMEEINSYQVRFNHASFLEVMVQPLYYIINKMKPVYCQQLGVPQGNIWALTSLILSSQQLQIIINEIIYQNIINVKNVIKVMRGIYIEFNDVSEQELINNGITLEQLEAIDQTLPNIVDWIFKFGKTHYYIQKQMLVVRINVYFQKKKNLQEFPNYYRSQLNDENESFKEEVKNNNSSQMQEHSNFSLSNPPLLSSQFNISKEKPQNKIILRREKICKCDNLTLNQDTYSYLQIVTSQFNLYEQIFNPEQIVQLLLNKIELENQMLKLSQNLSDQYKKFITITFNYESLITIFKGILAQTKQDKDPLRKIAKYEQIWLALENFQDYFLTQDISQQIQQQLKSQDFQELFLGLLFNICSAYTEKCHLKDRINNPLIVFQTYNIQEDNIQINEQDDDINPLLPEKQKEQQSLDTIQFLTQFSVLNDNQSLFQFSFILQININYFITFSKIGDMQLFCFFQLLKQFFTFISYILGEETDNGYQILKFIQLAARKNGKLYYINLDERKSLSLQELQQRNENNQNNQYLNRYQKVNIEQIKFSLIVTKTWPDEDALRIQFKNIAILDNNLNLFSINSPAFIQICRELSIIQNQTDINQIDNNQQQVPMPDQQNNKSMDQNLNQAQQNAIISNQLLLKTINLFYRQKLEIESDISVNNIVQFLPSIISFDIEFSDDPNFLPYDKNPNNLSYLKQKFQQINYQDLEISKFGSIIRQQSMIRTLQNNLQSIKIKFNSELNFRVDDIQAEILPLSTQFEINDGLKKIIHQFQNDVRNVFNRYFENFQKDKKQENDLANDLNISCLFSNQLNQNKKHHLNTAINYLHIILSDISNAFFDFLNCEQNNIEFQKVICLIYPEPFSYDINVNSLLRSLLFKKYIHEIRLNFDLQQINNQIDQYNQDQNIYSLNNLLSFDESSKLLIINIYFSEYPQNHIISSEARLIKYYINDLLINKEKLYIYQQIYDFNLNLKKLKDTNIKHNQSQHEINKIPFNADYSGIQFQGINCNLSNFLNCFLDFYADSKSLSIKYDSANQILLQQDQLTDLCLIEIVVYQVLIGLKMLEQQNQILFKKISQINIMFFQFELSNFIIELQPLIEDKNQHISQDTSNYNNQRFQLNIKLPLLYNSKINKLIPHFSDFLQNDREIIKSLENNYCISYAEQQNIIQLYSSQNQQQFKFSINVSFSKQMANQFQKINDLKLYSVVLVNALTLQSLHAEILQCQQIQQKQEQCSFIVILLSLQIVLDQPGKYLYSVFFQYDNKTLFLADNILFFISMDFRQQNQQQQTINQSLFNLKQLLSYQEPDILVGQSICLALHYGTEPTSINNDNKILTQPEQQEKFIMKTYVTIQKKRNNLTYNLSNFISEQKKIDQSLKAFSYWLTNEVLILVLMSKKSQSIQIKLTPNGKSEDNKNLFITLNFQDYFKQYQDINLIFTHNSVVDITHTIYMGTWNPNSKRIIQLKNEEQKKQDDFRQYKNPLFQRFQQSIDIKNMNMDNLKLIKSEQDIIQAQLVSIQQFNVLSSLSNKQKESYSRAGEERVDLIKLFDSQDNYFDQISNILPTIKAYFVHSLYPQIAFEADVKIFDAKLIDKQDKQIVDNMKLLKESAICLIWKPFIKGVYNLIINKTYIKMKSQVVVLANDIDINQTILEFPDNKKISFYEQISCIIKFKDKYQNSIGDLEQKIYYQNKDMFQIDHQSDQGSHMKVTNLNLDKQGIQQIQIIVTLPDAHNQNDQLDQITIKFNVNGQQFKNDMHLQIQGISFEERKKHFYEELDKLIQINQYYDNSVNISRINFIEELPTVLEKVNLKSQLYIVYKDELGIDAGGLKREFYDQVGQSIKNSRLRLFEAVPASNEKIFFHPLIHKAKEQNKYLKLFGKLLAHTILVQQLLGIEFIIPFVKLLYGQEISFSDLKDYLDKNTYNNYNDLLAMNEEDLDAMELYFSTTNNEQQQIDLKEQGQTIKVNKDNVKEYLDLMAQYILKKPKYLEYVATFKEGFESIFKVSLLQNWFTAMELSILTCGVKELNSELLNKLIEFSGGNNVLYNFFRRYLSEASVELLRNFLKFTTGSSSIPVDQQNYKINIEFVKNRDTNNLPISHTCFKSLEVPHYPSYEMLKKKFTIAFTMGTEGFGFG